MNPNVKYLLSIESKGIKLGLQRTKFLSDNCGNPHKNLKIIQVAGTNGKGSTCAIIYSILRNANYNVGLFTSPHLLNVNERIRINGQPISDQHISEYIKNYKNNIEKISASFFETITIMAFWYFKKMNVDYAIMETGLGGRLDSVTICTPILTVITSISLDHTEILGSTLSQITNEKIGIIKKKIPCITIKHNKIIHKIIKDKCIEKQAPLIIVNNSNPLNYQPILKGDAQYENALLAETAVNTLKINIIKKNHIINGIQNVIWHGRNQIIKENPKVIFDVAHNESGIVNFINFFKSYSQGKKILVLSMQKRKKISSISDLIIKTFDYIICCETINKRTMTIKELKSNFINSRKIKCIKSEYEAINYSLNIATQDDSIAIIGTHYLAEAISKIFKISFNLL